MDRLTEALSQSLFRPLPSPPEPPRCLFDVLRELKEISRLRNNEDDADIQEVYATRHCDYKLGIRKSRIVEVQVE
eukprot:CAMPEP_0201623328 /NCGR_PEP_ID=MMETSP0492-20130828/47874_1 /ASSEMBLY_ACC=CAM_ASM_000837 /TAXON_ID=420259 /ORGANISM="Thalassiosira gravida, Strain GMp14c1" /LENGTH=74 /DNA_ID=CAMNT_0048092961 /DNA_START=620 /DNA_END=844 /DNA_ORIENTATION=-